MSTYKIMKIINKLMNNGISELNRHDIEVVFDMDVTYDTKEIFEYLGCTVTYVADIFNVKMPETKFTREEMLNQKRIENLLAMI